MGVMCQILLQRPAEGYWMPGSNVSGVIQYAIDEVTEYSAITIALVGKGNCHWTERSSGKDKRDHHYSGNEDYLKIKTNVLNKNEGETVKLSPGSYKFQFDFILPRDLPPSYKDSHSKIKYAIVVKFKRPGLFQFNKNFHVETIVGGSFYPESSQEPITFGLDKTLYNLLAMKKGDIHLKAVIEKSFLVAGDLAKLDFAVENDSKVVIPSIQIELRSLTTYTASTGRTKTVSHTISNSTFNTASIADKSKSNLNTLLRIPNGIFSVQHSKIVSKKYMLKVTVRLPLPHINASLDIPIVIAKPDLAVEEAKEPLDSDDDEVKPPKLDDAPPSYWEAMAEDDGKGEKLFAL